MIKAGGYILGYQDTASWARRRSPDINIYDETLIPDIVRRHNKRLGGKMSVVPAYHEGRVWYLFLMHYKDDPKAVRGACENFEEDEGCIWFKHNAFIQKEDFEKVRFLTIVDPFNVKDY
ncbi:hypothetical protein H2248_003836 [Termitomyces sp. 'cryptogamus']|nr:hypothetical protein H2248_003836 [Termitomyces sp. 'cryptogamus']